MITWVLLFSIPMSVIALIIWDAEKRPKGSGANNGVSPLGVISVVTAVGSAGIASASFSVAQRSSEIAERSLIAANRPWIKVDIEVGGAILFNDNGANFTLNYSLKNIGHSPATNVWVSAKAITPMFSKDGTGTFNPRGELLRIIADRKNDAPGPFGFALFPEETIVQPMTVSISKEELARATAIGPVIYPRIVGSVSYRMGFDSQPHQSGFIVEVRRNDAPRPITVEKRRWPAAIFIDEGDVPAADVRLFRSPIDGGYAD